MDILNFKLGAKITDKLDVDSRFKVMKTTANLTNPMRKITALTVAIKRTL